MAIMSHQCAVATGRQALYTLTAGQGGDPLNAGFRRGVFGSIAPDAPLPWNGLILDWIQSNSPAGTSPSIKSTATFPQDAWERVTISQGGTVLADVASADCFYSGNAWQLPQVLVFTPGQTYTVSFR
jgi:hypothetical protein